MATSFPALAPARARRAAILLLTITSQALPSMASAAAPPIASSTGTELHCPATLAQVPVADGVPPGWVVHGPAAELRLQRAAFYDGDPVGLGSLAPESTHRSGLVETSTWSFAAGDSAQVWIACLYRDATAVVARPLPQGLHQCTTTLRLTALGDPSGALAIRCQ
jgi:hypothetical protein